MGDNWAFYFSEMWERLWDMIIYPIMKIFGYEIVDGKLVNKNEAAPEA